MLLPDSVEFIDTKIKLPKQKLKLLLLTLSLANTLGVVEANQFLLLAWVLLDES